MELIITWDNLIEVAREPIQLLIVNYDEHFAPEFIVPLGIPPRLTMLRRERGKQRGKEREFLLSKQLCRALLCLRDLRCQGWTQNRSLTGSRRWITLNYDLHYSSLPTDKNSLPNLDVNACLDNPLPRKLTSIYD